MTDEALLSAPTVDPTLTAFDTYGNEVYNASGSAYLIWASGYVPAPRITGLSVTIGPASGDSSVTITGDGFTGVTAVDFGSNTPAASYTFNGDTSITAVTPITGAGTVDVTVTTAGGPNLLGPSDQFTFVAQPSVSAVSPNRGPLSGGTLVTLTGANFTDATTVKMGDTPVGFLVGNDSTITVVTPPGESIDSEQFTVVSPGGTSPTSSADQFSYSKATLVLSPRSGVAGTSVAASGHGYSSGETVDVSYRTGLRAPNPTTVLLCSGQASANGAFSCKGTIPTTDSGSTGSHKITAKGTASLLVASVVYTLT